MHQQLTDKLSLFACQIRQFINIEVRYMVFTSKTTVELQDKQEIYNSIKRYRAETIHHQRIYQ